MHIKHYGVIIYKGQVTEDLYTTSPYQVSEAFSFYDMLIMNTSETESVVLATIVFGTHIPKQYTDEILFLPTSRHDLLANASTSEEIINQTNKTMFLQSVENYMKKLTTQPPTNDPTLISNMISLCADKFKMPSNQSLTLFVNRISPDGKLQKKNKSKKSWHLNLCLKW